MYYFKGPPERDILFYADKYIVSTAESVAPEPIAVRWEFGLRSKHIVSKAALLAPEPIAFGSVAPEPIAFGSVAPEPIAFGWD